MPVWRLLGGKVRDSLRTYTHLGLGDMRAVYEIEHVAPRSSSSAGVVTQAGYDALKVVCIPYTPLRLAAIADVDSVARMVGDLREAVGPDIDIMVDFHGRPASVDAALDYIHAMRRRAASCSSRSRFRPRTSRGWRGHPPLPMPIASGERLIGRREFEPAFRARAFNIAQPDICHTGGFWEAKKIAAMAETAGIGLAPHNPLGPIAGVAALHFGISTPNVIIQEEMSGAVPWYGEVVAWPIERKPGRWDKPQKPGLGIEVDEAVIDAHPFQPDILHARGAVLPTAPWWTGERDGRPSRRARRAIVTGAGQGIGEAIAPPVRRAGRRVFIGEINVKTGAGGRRRDRCGRRHGALRPDRRHRQAARRAPGRNDARRTSAASTSSSTMPAPTSSSSRSKCPTRRGGAAWTSTSKRRGLCSRAVLPAMIAQARRRDRQHCQLRTPSRSSRTAFLIRWPSMRWSG